MHGLGWFVKKTRGEIVRIDGKTERRSGGQDLKPIHTVSGWANRQQMTVGQIATDEKPDEIAAVPELLIIAGCSIKADAMSCQKMSQKNEFGKMRITFWN